MSGPRRDPSKHAHKPTQAVENTPPARKVIRRFELSGLLTGLAIFIVALGVRLAYLYDSSDSPTFRTPIVDAKNYDNLARLLSPHIFADGPADEKLSLADQLLLFWQPFLYPYTLGALYRIAELRGQDPLLFAKVVQLVVGALTCVLVYALGRRLFGRGTGVIAALMTAFCGPLIYYEADLVAAGWAAFWSAALVLLAVKAGRDGSIVAAWLAGAGGGLAVLMRPTFLPFLVALLAWLIVRCIRDKRGAVGSLVRVAPAVLLFGLVVYPVANKAHNYELIRKYTFLPVSGGINFYIGNNENVCETLNTRPGMTKWSKLAEPSGAAGDTNTLERSQLLGRQALEFIKTHPFKFVRGLVDKVLRFASGREMPRNEDVYVFRRWSPLLSVLLWKAGPFGFPWGVLFPLALVGLVWRRKDVPGPLALYLVLYPLSIILIFVSGRYRVETVPVFAVPAAACVWGMIEVARARKWLLVAGPLGYVAALGVLTSLPGPFCEEEVNYEAEMYVWLGDDKRLQAKPLLKIPYDASEEVVKAMQAEADRLHNEARAFYERAATLAPDSVVARVHLGYLLKSMRRYEEALQHLDFVLQQEPDFLAYYYRGDLYSRMRDQERALRDFNSCVEAEPRFKPGLLARSAIYQAQGRVEEAKADCRRVLELCAQVIEYQEARKALKQQIDQVRARAAAEGRALTQSEIEFIKPREEMIGILNYRIENHPDRDAAHSASSRLRQLEQQS